MKNCKSVNLLFQYALCCTIVILFVQSKSYCQSDSVKASQYEDLSLKELLSVKIVSVSKKSESLFDAPLSASVVTKEDIRKTGCTSIMEALRLVPGMIVREQTNGNYDIYLRGMDNVPPDGPFEGNSTTTLVMIDNRPIYNYLKGGTFWETLPVDLNDVEKIEVIRGPAAALYGPNAVNGVINIITRQIQKDGLYLVANAKQGSYNTFINNVSAGYRGKKYSVIASGNYQGRERTQTSYYELFGNRWLNQSDYFVNIVGDTSRNVNEQYPNPQQAMEKYAGNVFFNYDLSDKVKFDLRTGIQHSMVQKVSTDNGSTPLSTVASDSRYADLRATVKGLSTQFSYNEGTQITGFPGNKYDFKTIDASAEYNYTKGNLTIKPGAGYRDAVYDDTKYSDIINKTGIFNAKGRITTLTASLRAEYKMFDNKLRLVAALAANKFNYPDTTYLSTQFAATYKISKRHLVRAVYSKSPRSSTVYDTYVNQRASYFASGYRNFIMLALEGNKNLQLLTAGMLEIGYRGNIIPGLNIDIEIFNINSKNYNSLVTHAPYRKLAGNDTITVIPLIPTNLPVTLRQQGITLSLVYSSKKLAVKPFITFQQSRTKNYAPFPNSPNAAPSAIQNDPAHNNIFSGMGTTAKLTSTPAVFGGASFDYKLNSKFNIDVSTYYYSAQTYYHVTNIIFKDGVRGVDHIKAKLILNANVSYQAVKGLNIFCSGKNILNNKSREFFRSDRVPFMLVGGLNFEL
ncbi:MAG: TonB-dependent receptor plug domain-containing protein [Ferruginibacter sp.]